MQWQGRIALGLMAWALVSVVHADSPRTPEEQKVVDTVRTAYLAKGLTWSPEQEDLVLAQFRQTEAQAIQRVAIMHAQLAANGNVAPVPVMAPMPSTAPAMAPTTAAVDIAPLVRAREANRTPATFDRLPGGFVANGRPFVDPLGDVVRFAGDAATGDVTFFVAQGDGTYLVRFTNINSALPPITVGQLMVAGGDKRFIGIDGQVIAGEEVLPLGRGLIVTRQGALFALTFGAGMDTQTLPAGYTVAPLQHGDVNGTGYVLLRRAGGDPQQNNTFHSIAHLVKDLRGQSDDRDYALLNLHTGHAVYLNSSIVTDTVSHATGCKGNGFVHKCSGEFETEQVFRDDGIPNWGHYYWSIRWFATADGPTAVVVENAGRQINVIRLDTEARATAFNETMGVTGFVATPTPDGSLSVTGKWLFKDHPLADVRTLFVPPADAPPATAPTTAPPASP